MPVAESRHCWPSRAFAPASRASEPASKTSSSQPRVLAVLRLGIDVRTLVPAIAYKEIRQLRRDRLTLGMIIGLPLMQMLLFGYAINFDVRHLRGGVLDEANT